MGIAIVFASGKGGTGKTSIVGGVASCLAAMGRRVLCVDCDAGLRNLDIILGMSDVAVMSFIDVIAGRVSLEDAAAPHDSIPGLFLITAPYSPDYSPETVSGFELFIKQARNSFDYVFLDCPAGIGSGFELASRFADRAVIVTTCDPTSIRDGQRTAQALKSLGVSENCMVVNRVSRRLISELGSTIDDAMDEIGLPLLGLVPEDSYVSLAPARGKALILVRDQGAAIAMVHIARRMEGIRTPLMKIK